MTIPGSLKIDAGIQSILINDGPFVLRFNPTDVLFVERFYKMVGAFEAKMKAYEEVATEIDADKSVAEDGLPANLPKRLEFLTNICQFAHGEIDMLFGEGTSQGLFGGMQSLDMIEQFFTGLAPLIRTTRDAKVGKYTGKNKKQALK